MRSMEDVLRDNAKLCGESREIILYIDYIYKMPFNHAKRYSRFKKLPFHRKVISVASTATTALRIAQGLAALINTEWKRKDTVFTDVPITGAGVVENLSLIALGNDDFERDGMSILPKSLDLRLSFDINTSATATIARVLVFKDMQYDGVIATHAQIMASPSNIFSYMNLDNSVRFKILRDFTVALTQDANKLVLRKAHIQFNKPNRGTRAHRHWYHIKYDGSAASIADGDSGQLCYLVMSNEAVNTPTITVNARLRYIDN